LTREARSISLWQGLRHPKQTVAIQGSSWNQSPFSLWQWMSQKGRIASAYIPAAAANGYGGGSSWRQMQNSIQSGRQRLFGVIRAASGPESATTLPLDCLGSIPVRTG
jgi:hypothetical protein